MRQKTRPVIGINMDLVPARKNTESYLRLTTGYCDAILNAGGLPVVMPPLDKESEINAFLDHVDGFMLTGGNDMDPRRQGRGHHAAVRPMAERRETNDRVLVRCIIERSLPVLGIGLGMQQLNVALGGTLHLHIPDDLPKTMPHFDYAEEGPHRHLVHLKPNTRLDEIYGGGELRVNSHHHQAVAELGDGLRIAAFAPDKVIEAIEVEDPNWFCIGVQWHPETDSASALDLQLFECFVQASIRQAEPLQLAA